MTGFLGEAYLWVKSVHVMAVIAWMAGMLYLPRLFVYHCDAPAGSPASETFKVMERRLLRAIINPAMVAAWILGLMLVAHLGAWDEGWMHGKFAFVVALTVIHHVFARWRKVFDRDANARSPRFYRYWNELPALLMVGIVILVIVKPF